MVRSPVLAVVVVFVVLVMFSLFAFSPVPVIIVIIAVFLLPFLFPFSQMPATVILVIPATVLRKIIPMS